MAAGNLAVDPVMQLATIGVSGVGAQWVAWRQRVPAIVLMLGIGLLAGSTVGCARSQGRTWRFDDTDHIHRGCGHSV